MLPDPVCASKSKAAVAGTLKETSPDPALRFQFAEGCPSALMEPLPVCACSGPSRPEAVESDMNDQIGGGDVI
jgi:hypothetical protein